MSMSYTTLTGSKTTAGSIKSWQNYALVDADGVLEDAQNWIYQSLRVREMRASVANLTASAGASTVALPTGFLDPISLRDITNDRDLTAYDEAFLVQHQSWSAGVLGTDDPTMFAIMDECFTFECKVETQFTMQAVFYKKPDLLGSGNTTNFLTARYSHLLHAVCQAFAAEFVHNTEDYARNIQRAGMIIADLNAQDELSRRGQETPVLAP